MTDTVPAGQIASLQSLLQTIQVSAGYRTNVAHVYVGQSALTLLLSDFPAITIFSLAEAPIGCTDSGSPEQEYQRTLEIECLVTDQGAWDTALEGILEDVRRCLLAYRSTALSYTKIDFIPPTPQSRFAEVKITLNLTYELQF